MMCSGIPLFVLWFLLDLFALIYNSLKEKGMELRKCSHCVVRWLKEEGPLYQGTEGLWRQIGLEEEDSGPRGSVLAWTWVPVAALPACSLPHAPHFCRGNLQRNPVFSQETRRSSGV